MCTYAEHIGPKILSTLFCKANLKRNPPAAAAAKALATPEFALAASFCSTEVLWELGFSVTGVLTVALDLAGGKP